MRGHKYQKIGKRRNHCFTDNVRDVYMVHCLERNAWYQRNVVDNSSKFQPESTKKEKKSYLTPKFPELLY